MSDLLSTSESLVLLENFRGIVRDFATREETLIREFRNLNENALARYERQKSAAKNALAAEQQEAVAARDARLNHVQEHFALRERRLHDAHASARKRALDQVDLEEGRRKYAVQKGTLEAQRRREESLAANDSALEQFRARLDEARAEREELEIASRGAFRGMPLFQRLLRKDASDTDADGGHDALLAESVQLQTAAKEDLKRFRGLLAPKLFRSAPLWVWIAIAIGLAAGLAPALQRLAYPISPAQGYAYAGALLALVLFLYFAAYQSGFSLAAAIATALLRSRTLQQAAEERAAAFHTSEIARIEHETSERVHQLNAEWEAAVQDAKNARAAWPEHLEQKWRRARVANEDRRAQGTSRVRTEADATGNSIQERSENRMRALEENHRKNLEELQTNATQGWRDLERQWQAAIPPILEKLEAARLNADRVFPDWSAHEWSQWSPPRDFNDFSPFGHLELDLAKYAGAIPQDRRLALPAGTVSVPLLLKFPPQGSLLFETSGPGKEAVIGALNNLVFRLLAGMPAGKLSFTIFDPVSLGQNFAAITHLADYEENLVNGRIWTQPDQLEQRLADLNDHMEKVIQMYLRNEYESIAEYNRAAGNIAEKYHFLIIADFPANLTEAGAKRLLRIAASGARCGVYTFIHWNHRQPQPPEHLADELRKSSIVVKFTGTHFVLADPAANPGKVLLDTPPSAEIGNRFLAQVGEVSRGASRVEVPFSQIAPKPAEIWSLDTATELRVPIGRSGANKLQYLALGRGTRQHALIAGKTGSGKSTLFHVMITNLALWASPEQVEFYLVDFKKGVEFKSYAVHQLPHARVVAIESDREFGLSVLQRVDEELRQRGELFRKFAVQDLAGYRAASGKSMPRTLLMIDEFQEFFVEEDRVAQSAAMLLDRIVRQGRAFGIHVLLGSQTLGGAYTLARATLGQMAIRIALQCNETDAYLIMDENNAAPRLLSRPGEGIYNDMSGAVEGNSPFQVVWLSESERAQALKSLHDRPQSHALPPPVVFEGNAPADIHENAAFQSLLSSPAQSPTDIPLIWLGAPNAIKGPTEAAFPRRSGSNLLIVGQKEETALTLLMLSLQALAAQFPQDQARFFLFETTAPGSPERAYIDSVLQTLRHSVTREAPEAPIAALAAELAGSADDRPRTFIFIHNLQNFKKLRAEDEFSFSADPESTAAQFSRIITEGAAHGTHIIASIDTYNNVTRFLGRKGLTEFSLRVLFQMSPSDSASLIEDSRASALGLHRGLLYNEQEGRTEIFRPYARPHLD